MIHLRNRRGQVAILMLFVVTIVLVIATLFVFFSSKSASPPSSGFSEVLSDGRGNLDSVKYTAKTIASESINNKVSDLKVEFIRIVNLKYGPLKNLGAVQVAPYGNFFLRAGDKDNKDLSFEKVVSKELYKLRITGLFVEASFGNNYEKKNFDLCMLFDGNGNYLEELANEGFYNIYCNK